MMLVIVWTIHTLPHLSKCVLGSNWKVNGLFLLFENGSQPWTFSSPVSVTVT